MRAHQIMTRQVITASVDTPIVEAARTLLKHCLLYTSDAADE